MSVCVCVCAMRCEPEPRGLERITNVSVLAYLPTIHSRRDSMGREGLSKNNSVIQFLLLYQTDFSPQKNTKENLLALALAVFIFRRFKIILTILFT